MHHEPTPLNKYAIATLRIFRTAAIEAQVLGDREGVKNFEAAIASLLEPEPARERATR